MASPPPTLTVVPVPARGVGTRATNSGGNIGSPDVPQSWGTMPRLESPIADLGTGQLTIPWQHFMIFLAARAAFLGTVQNDVTTLQNQVATLQQNVTTLQGQVTTIQSDIGTLQGQTSSLQGQINTINGEISSINGQIAGINNTTASLQGQINTINTRLANAGIP